MLSIVVLSSDGYSDCWIPFFKLLKKNFREIYKYEILLSTNTKEFSYPELHIKTLVHGIDTPWSKRLKETLRQASNNIVLILVEDLILRSEINIKMFNNFLSIISTSDKVDHIRLLSTFDRTMVKKSPYENLDEIEDKTKLRFLYLPGLWKKNVLLKYLVDYESPFISERLGDYRSYIYNHKFYCVSKKYVDFHGQFYDCRPSGALFKGKWQNWVAPFFKKNDIDIDLELRGFVTEEFAKKTRAQSKILLLKSPVTTLRSIFSVILLFIKVKIFNYN